MKHVADPVAERVTERRAAHRPSPADPAQVLAQREVAESTVRPTRPLSVRSAVLLQRQAGNRATARLMAQRQKATPPASGNRGANPTAQSAAAGPATAEVAGLGVQRLVAGRGGPGQDPKFTALKQDVKSKQQAVGKHPPAQSEATAAQGAAKPPPDDKVAQGKAANAEKMNAAKPGDFDKAAFIKAVNDAIAKQAPKNLNEADKFGDSGKANAVKGEVQGKVGAGKEASAKAIETTTKAPPDTAAAKDKQVTPLRPDQPPPTPGAPNPDQAVPDKAPPAATDFSDGPKQVDKQMTDAQVTEEQLAKSNEPEFTGALKEKKAGEQHAATAPGQVRAAEAKTLSGAKASAAQAGAAAMTTMTADRTKAGQQVHAGKEGAKGDDESKRAQVTAKLQTVFDATKKDVEAILKGLDKKVDDEFSKGEKAARDAFTADYTKKMDAYKDKRYSGFWGPARWVKDKFAGLPDEVNVFYEQARQGYVNQMQGVISSVADVIGGELTRAKQRIAIGRNELQAAVKALSPELQAIGKHAAGEFSSKFDELTQSVNDKGTQLVDTLASKYTAALKAVDDEIEGEKEKNKGLIAKAIDAVKGVIDTILKLKDLLLSVLAKATQAVMAIIKDPIGFLGHLVSAVGAGLKAFMANIATHLQKGLVSWLLGAAAAAGLQLPEKFDLKGILALIGSLLGLTWAAIRGRVVSKGVPEQAMGAVESSVAIVPKIQKEGIGGIWEEIKEKVGDLKQGLFGKITEYLIPTVIIAGITWLISLLTPASAFIKACKAIIDIVTFIVDRGAQIIAFVNAILDAVIAIAAGGAGGVPGLIETALATAIPVLIGFLAALLGIGGLADKVKKFFQALSKPVMKAVDWVVDKIVAFGKKIWAKLKGKGKQGKDDKATAADSKVQRPDVAVGFEMAGESHQLKFDASPNGVQVLMASQELPLTTKFRQAHTLIDNFKHYMSTVTDPVVKERYDAELAPKLEGFPATKVDDFKKIYNQFFPPGSAPAPLGPQQRKNASAQVEPLVVASQQLLAEIKAWGSTTGISDLSEAKINATLQNKGNEIWKQAHAKIQERINGVLAGFNYKGLPLGYVGSAQSGWRGPPKGTTHFDASNFDVDLYVVHPAEYDSIARRKPELVIAGKIFPGAYASELRALSTSVAAALAAEFPNVARIDKSNIVLRRVRP
jgi:hypothetical protein